MCGRIVFFDITAYETIINRAKEIQNCRLELVFIDDVAVFGGATELWWAGGLNFDITDFFIL